MEGKDEMGNRKIWKQGKLRMVTENVMFGYLYIWAIYLLLRTCGYE